MKKKTSLDLSVKAPTDREKMWAAMRQLQEFTTLEAARLSGCDKSKVCDYLKGLTRAGFVVRANPGSGTGKDAAFALLKDTGVDAPRVRRDGTVLPQSGRNRMWRVMQVLTVFTEAELVDAASLPEAPVALGEAKTYCQWLQRGGYLRAGKNGTWRMIPAKFSGAKAPQILRVKKLFDPNLGRVVYEGPEAGSDEQ